MSEDSNFDNLEIVNDVNTSELSDMVEQEGETIAPEISNELDSQMSNDVPEGLFENVAPADDNPNRQLTEEEIAALFAGL